MDWTSQTSIVLYLILIELNKDPPTSYHSIIDRSSICLQESDQETLCLSYNGGRQCLKDSPSHIVRTSGIRRHSVSVLSMRADCLWASWTQEIKRTAAVNQLNLNIVRKLVLIKTFILLISSWSGGDSSGAPSWPLSSLPLPMTAPTNELPTDVNASDQPQINMSDNKTNS